MIEAVHYSVWTGKRVPKTRSRLLCLITCITRVHVPQLHLSHDSVAAFALHRFRGPVVLSIIDEERETWTATYMVSIRSEPSLLVYASCARCARCATSRAMAFSVTGLWDNDVLFDTCARARAGKRLPSDPLGQGQCTRIAVQGHSISYRSRGGA